MVFFVTTNIYGICLDHNTTQRYNHLSDKNAPNQTICQTSNLRHKEIERYV